MNTKVNVSITGFLLALCSLPFSADTATAAAEAGRKAGRPNIVIIYIDDMGYADIGPFGAKGYATPNLDRMAREGMKFTSFYSAQAVCSASRTALLTGCYPNRLGIGGALGPHSKVGISSKEMTIAQVCKQRGYATAIFGKWHLGDARQFLPLQHGFDEYFGLPYSNDMTPHRYPGETRDYMKLPLINQNTVVNPDVGDAAQDQLTTWYTEHAVSFIHRHKGEPFFFYVPHAMVHVPLHVSDKFRGKTTRGLFGDVVEELDWSVGQILAALKEDGLDERTLVMFCSDNGPWLCFGEHAGSAYPLREGKGTSWDGGVREPTLMRWPGHIPAGRVCDAPLMTIDMLPTIAHLTGAKLPPNKIDGLDITDVLTGKTEQSPHDVLYFYYHQNDLESLRSGKWKLEMARNYQSLNGRPGGKNGRPAKYESLKIPQPELFDLNADPGEQHDVTADHPDVVKNLLAGADRMRVELGDGLTKQKGTARREPGRVTDQDVFPSDAAFPKAFEAKYRPGVKEAGEKDQRPRGVKG
jgi:arylsulfatase A-like enzyme